MFAAVDPVPGFRVGERRSYGTNGVARPPSWASLSNAAALGFLWSLSRDLGDLRERMARLEGLFEGFMRREGGAGREAVASSL